MNQYLYQLQLVRPALLSEGPTANEAAVLQRHVEYLERLAQESIVLLAGRTQIETPDAFGLVIFKAATAADAKRIMQADPAVQESVMRATLYPYRIAVLADAIVNERD